LYAQAIGPHPFLGKRAIGLGAHRHHLGVEYVDLCPQVVGAGALPFPPRLRSVCSLALLIRAFPLPLGQCLSYMPGGVSGTGALVSLVRPFVRLFEKAVQPGERSRLYGRLIGRSIGWARPRLYGRTVRYEYQSAAIVARLSTPPHPPSALAGCLRGHAEPFANLGVS